MAWHGSSTPATSPTVGELGELERRDRCGELLTDDERQAVDGGRAWARERLVPTAPALTFGELEEIELRDEAGESLTSAEHEALEAGRAWAREQLVPIAPKLDEVARHARRQTASLAPLVSRIAQTERSLLERDVARRAERAQHRPRAAARAGRTRRAPVPRRARSPARSTSDDDPPPRPLDLLDAAMLAGGWERVA
jgi:hypothetical protein